MRWFELKIPPLFLVPVVMLLMSVTAWLLPAKPFSVLGMVFFIVVALLSLKFLLLSTKTFHEAETTLNPNPNKTTSLVTDGVFRYTRNPIYLGFMIFLLGFAGLLGSVWALFWIGVFVAYLTQFQIKPEERILQEKFSQQYKNYQQRVRRWI